MLRDVPLLPRFTAASERTRDAEQLARVMREVDIAESDPPPPAGSLTGGVPIVGRGTAGAIRGSNPLAEVLRREKQRRRR